MSRLSHSAGGRMDPGLLSDARQLMKARMDQFDPSHDSLHVIRVHNMAVRVCEALIADGKTVDREVVQLAALFHDMDDHKYEGHGSAGSTIVEVMQKHNVSSQKIDLVLQIIRNTSYSKEQKAIRDGTLTDWHRSCLELHCVQDADRLDAIGAFGIYRVAAFSGAHGRPLYGPGDTAHQHFYDKLLKVKDSMKTPLGRRVADKRTEIMKQFVQTAEQEAALGDF